jgi:hypothetical protein
MEGVVEWEMWADCAQAATAGVGYDESAIQLGVGGVLFVVGSAQAVIAVDELAAFAGFDAPIPGVGSVAVVLPLPMSVEAKVQGGIAQPAIQHCLV